MSLNRKSYPFWLINQLNAEQKIEADRLLFEGRNAGDLAEYFGVYNPYKDKHLRSKSSVYLTPEQKIELLKYIANELHKDTLTQSDYNEYAKKYGVSNFPTVSTFRTTFDGWQNALKIAGLKYSEQIHVKTLEERKNLIGHNLYEFENKNQIHNEVKHKQYEKNPENIKEQVRQKYHENREHNIVRMRNYLHKNREEINAKRREFYKENKEMLLARNRKWVQENREKKYESNRRWRQKVKNK